MALFRYTLVRFFWMALGLFFVITLVFIATRVAHINVWFVHLEFPDTIYFVWDEYVVFVKNIVTRWDWGSIRGEPVWDTLLENAPITLKLNFIALLVYLPSGILIGVMCALYQNSLFDKIVSGVLLVLGSIPSFIWIFVFILFFGYTISILPPQPPSVETPLYWRIAGWIMPVTALALAPIAKFAGMMRNELIENKFADYQLLLRTKGLSKRQVLFRHTIRDSLVPVMPEIAPTFVFVIVGSFFVEKIYNMQGTATLLFDSMFQLGFGFYYVVIHSPMVVMICTFYSALTFLFIFLMDITYAIVDPRMRVGKTK